MSILRSLFVGSVVFVFSGLVSTMASADSIDGGKGADAIACSTTLVQSSLCLCQVMALHPTQFTVGMIEVNDKRKELNDFKGDRLRKYEKDHPEPVVIGPGGVLYITDHHHLALALVEAGASSTYCQIVANYSDLTQDAFWSSMQQQGWVYPYERGRGPLAYSELPANVTQLTDDPYRSLVGAVRDAGDIDKSEQPYAEFLWADYFRPLIAEADMAMDFTKAVKTARIFAHSPAASSLPGYRAQ